MHPCLVVLALPMETHRQHPAMASHADHHPITMPTTLVAIPSSPVDTLVFTCVTGPANLKHLKLQGVRTPALASVMHIFESHLHMDKTEDLGARHSGRQTAIRKTRLLVT